MIDKLLGFLKAEILKSKKFQAALLGMLVVVVTAVLGKFGITVSEESTMQIVGLIMAYILGQGMADWSKNSNPPPTAPQG